MSRAGQLNALFAHLHQLKSLKRTGWLDRGVPPEDAESVADHTTLTALIAWLVALDDPELDASRVLQLALVHDLAESIAGDPTPYEREEILPASDPAAVRAFFSVRHPRSAESRVRKQEAETAAMTRLTGLLPEIAADELAALWEEYEAQSSPEARFVKQVDLLEAFLQSREYAERFPDLPFDGFRLQAEQEISHPALVALRDDRLHGSLPS
jgi:putative hydrolase of HD superfamily